MMAYCLLLSVVGVMAQEAEVIRVVRPTMYQMDAYNLIWQAVAEDGTTRWQMDMYKVKNIEDKTYGNETLLGGYTYAYDYHDSIARMEITAAEMTFSHDTDGLEHVVANVTCGRKSYKLVYDEPKALPEAKDTIVLEVADAEFSDMRQTYGNMRMSGEAGTCKVSVTLSGDSKETVDGRYDWSRVCAFGTEIEVPATHQFIPARDIQVNLREQVYADTTGYVLEGEILGADTVLYKVTMYYHPRRPYTKKVLAVADYTMWQQGDKLQLELVVNKDTVFTLLVHATEMEELHTYSMQNGELESEYVDADTRAYINKEHAEGETYAIEANIYTEEYVHYILIYDGEKKEPVTGMEDVRDEKQETRKEIREGRVVIETKSGVYEVSGAFGERK